MRLPDFVILGAQKAGTTWLVARLAEQPCIFLPRPFELHYFDVPGNFAKGPHWYAEQFEAAPETALVGEKTPDYFWANRAAGRGPADIPARMHALLPSAKLIVVMRDPVRRAISALNHVIRSRGLSPFVDPDSMLTAALQPNGDRYGLVSRGHYLENLQRFLEYYPRVSIHVVFLEDDIIGAPEAAVLKTMAFLGQVGDQPSLKRRWPENKGMNSRLGLILNYYAPALSPIVSGLDRLLPEAPSLGPSEAVRVRLYEHFAPHNEALFGFLGRSTDAWNTR